MNNQAQKQQQEDILAKIVASNGNKSAPSTTSASAAAAAAQPLATGDQDMVTRMRKRAKDRSVSKSADVTNSGKKCGKVMFTAIARKDPLYLTFTQDGGHSFSQDAYDELEKFINE